MPYPETSSYLTLALGVVGTLTIGYLLTLWVRFQQAHKDIETLEKLNHD
ncbi:MAG: hypothetical protein ACOYLB_10290 [Phototrophicaceae bacterium]